MGSVSAAQYDLAKFGEVPIKPKRDKFNIEIVFVDNHELMQEHWQMFKSDGSKREVRAFALVNKKIETCYLFLPKPSHWDDIEYLAIVGHEIMHCTLADHGKPLPFDPSK